MKDAYVAYVLQEYILDGNFNSQFGNEWVDIDNLQKLMPSVCDHAFAQYGIDAQGKYLSEVMSLFDLMREKSAIVEEGDEYAGRWFKLRPTIKDKLIREVQSANPASAAISKIGEEALRRALLKIVDEDGLRSTDQKSSDDGDLEPAVSPIVDTGLELRNVPNPNFFNSEAGRSEFVSVAEEAAQRIENSELSNAERSQARGYLAAARALADTPEPPVDLIWDILSRANSLAGIGSFFLALITLVALAV